ncbi:MAG TPA: 1,2-phenylacetyl-CoA epoxidase subunit PaaC [Myxococcota bacterium]|nr:1,2-phenylacetyl-CoA epoxidase subunit PaaC [Myxococcota bacterium]
MSAELFELLLRLGDDRLVLGHRLSEWCGHAPIVEEDIALANVALDCIGQASQFLELAGEIEGEGRDADALAFLRDPTQFRNCLLVEQPNGDFAQTIARQVLFDAAGAHVLAQLADSTHERLAAIARKAANEVRYHVRHARDWWLRLGLGTDEAHARLQAGLDELWPHAAELVTPDALDAALCASGVGPDLAAVRVEFERDVAALIAAANLRRPPDAPNASDGGRRGKHSEHLDHLLSEMQCVARAHPGARW